MSVISIPQPTCFPTVALVVVGIASALFYRIFYSLHLHPLAKFPGPWYTASFSLPLAFINWKRIEPEWLGCLVKRYGTNPPIRISPNLLLFSKPSALKEIYWDPKCNTKSEFYGTGLLGPPHLFSTLDPEEHKSLRKALGGPQWSIGSLKKNWEPRFDDQIRLLTAKLEEKARRDEVLCLSDKVAEFAADIMTMISFTEPWGFVKNGRDERGILKSWRDGLDFYGFVPRSNFFRNYIFSIPGLNMWFLPKYSSTSGMGWLMYQADRKVVEREAELDQGIYPDRPDFLQNCLEARIDGQPLSAMQKRSHATILIQAGADTTGTALGSTLRFLLTHPSTLSRARQEIETAEQEGRLSAPIQYEETRSHLPYIVACIKESLRLQPSAPNLLPRVIPTGGATISGEFIPAGATITSQAYVVQRDPELYAPDPETYRPERWLEGVEKEREMDAVSFVFGMGPRVCLGKDIVVMELWKLVPELVRRFDFELVREGTFVVAGGIGYNKDFMVKLTPRASSAGVWYFRCVSD